MRQREVGENSSSSNVAQNKDGLAKKRKRLRNCNLQQKVVK